MDNTHKKILTIAKHTRDWAEKLQRDGEGEGEDLACMCAIASYELFKRLKRAGLSPTMCFADKAFEGHAFVRCQGLTIDVTATQFGVRDKVNVLFNEDAIEMHWFWKPNLKVKSKKNILKQLSNWPKYQIHPELRSRVGYDWK